MKRRGSGEGGGGDGHGPSSGASSGRRRHREGEGESEGKLRIHLRRSCTNRKLVPEGSANQGLTTDDWQKFQKLLASKTFTAHDTQRIRGEDLTAEWAQETGFREPVIAPDKAGTGLMVPDASFTVADVARIVGEEEQIRPIHVGEQANLDQSMSLAEFAEYFETCTKPGQAILNMISLEFSDTPLAELVQSPKLVRDMDWINRCWPDSRKRFGQFPKVQYYCLMSQGGSYTDFHVDFGGTSVWYHILRGKKEFLLIRPTQSNLELYEGWIRSPTQSQVFFGDIVDICYRVVLNAGETLMIPSGWIHAVFTPKPSLVFGGNFLHSANITMQLQIHAIETRAKIQNKFRFPYFKDLMFFAASWYTRILRDEQGNISKEPRGEATEDTTEDAPQTDLGHIASGREKRRITSWEREGLPSLLEACREWLTGEVEGNEKEKLSEEWNEAAAAAGCADVSEMLRELGLKVSALEQTNQATEGGETPVRETASLECGGGDDEKALTLGNGGGYVVDGESCNDNHNHDNKEKKEEKGNDRDPSGGEKDTPAMREAKRQPQTQTGAASSRSEDDGAGSSMSRSISMPSEGADVGGKGEDEGPRALGVSTAGLSKEAKEGPPGFTIPKLKISIKPPSLRAARVSGTALAREGGKPSPAATRDEVGTVAKSGAVGKSRSAGSLKLVLKRPALSSASASASTPMDVVGGGGGAGSGDGDGHKRSRRPTEKARWKKEEEEDFKSVFGSSDDDDDGVDGSGDVVSKTKANAKGGEDEEWTDESRGGGRGGKKRARPLRRRLRAIARLGDDTAAGDSAEDSADEYKPEAEDDEMLTEDHSVNLDDDDVRETRKARASAQRFGKESAAASAGRAGSAWSGLAGGEGATGAEVRRMGAGQGMGVRRFVSATKQEALRSKGLFKIAPQSKVSVQPGKKEKKTLTAKQKLLAKMRR